MSKLEEDAINSLIIDIKNNTSNNSVIKKLVSNKNICTAAVKYNTIGEAYKDIEKNISVYLVKEEKNNAIKINAYTKCSKTAKNGENLCHLHCRMIKTNEIGLKIFDKDIIPNDVKDKTKWLANINDDFFENMGKRGAKKKNNSNIYTFSDPLDPILLVLNHKNAKLYSRLREYAKDLIDGIIDHKSIKSRKDIKKMDDINDLINSIQSDDYETVISSEDNTVSSEDESEYIQIYSKDNQEFYLDKNNYEVYRSDDNNNDSDDGTCIINIGILKESSEEYHYIKYDNKFYSIVKEGTIKKRGSVYLSKISKIIFDKKMNYIGNLIIIDENEDKYSYQFCDEI